MVGRRRALEALNSSAACTKGGLLGPRPTNRAVGAAAVGDKVEGDSVGEKEPVHK
jgi:hypothetical protein